MKLLFILFIYLFEGGIYYGKPFILIFAIFYIYYQEYCSICSTPIKHWKSKSCIFEPWKLDFIILKQNSDFLNNSTLLLKAHWNSNWRKIHTSLAICLQTEWIVFPIGIFRKAQCPACFSVASNVPFLFFHSQKCSLPV